MRCASTRVLPEPAPATMSSGPPSWTTAWRCGPLSPASMRSSSRPSGAGRGALECGGTGEGLLDAAHDHITVSRTGDTPPAPSTCAPPVPAAVLAAVPGGCGRLAAVLATSAFTTATGIRSPSPLAEHTPHQTPRARRAPGRSSFPGHDGLPPPEGHPMSTTTASTVAVTGSEVDRIGELAARCSRGSPSSRSARCSASSAR